MMRTMELFSGTKSFSKVLAAAGHGVFTVDNNHKLVPDLCTSIFSLENNDERFDFLDMMWASPPCEGFSVAVIGRNWNHDHTPKTDTARMGEALLKKTLDIIGEAKPKWWFIENPRGKMRRMPYMFDPEEEKAALHPIMMGGVKRVTVAYCQYGDTRMKPTDIWTNALWWNPKPVCKNGDPCHEAAPRGSRTGTQGLKGATERGVIPPALFEDILAQMPKE